MIINRRKHKNRATCEGMTLVEVVVFMGLTLSIMGGLFTVISTAKRMDHSSEERLAAFFHCKSVLEKLRNADLDILVNAGSFEEGKGNNGHGNNYSGYDISNPGKKKTGTVIPTIDDEKNGGGKVIDGGITVIANPVNQEQTVNFMTKASGAEISGDETVMLALAMQNGVPCYLASIVLEWNTNIKHGGNSALTESISTVIYP